MSSDGTHVWVTNYFGNSLGEVDASTGVVVQVISGLDYGFKYPSAVSSDGARVWVVNRDSLTELDASSGALVQVLSGSRYGFVAPESVSSDGTHVWVANDLGNSVTESSRS